MMLQTKIRNAVFILCFIIILTILSIAMFEMIIRMT